MDSINKTQLYVGFWTWLIGLAIALIFLFIGFEYPMGHVPKHIILTVTIGVVISALGAGVIIDWIVTNFFEE